MIPQENNLSELWTLIAVFFALIIVPVYLMLRFGSMRLMKRLSLGFSILLFASASILFIIAAQYNSMIGLLSFPLFGFSTYYLIVYGIAWGLDKISNSKLILYLIILLFILPLALHIFDFEYALDAMLSLFVGPIDMK